jgi:molybdate transport system ATP-binding protein
VNAFELRARYPGFSLEASSAWTVPRAALFGASGSGKTTVLEAIAGARPEVAGPVTIRGRRVDGLTPRGRGVGWVPQDASLFPHLTVEENLAFAVFARGDRAAAGAAVEALEIGPLLRRRARDLSGGERQRVAIARALASRPDFLLLDEPLASIDRPLRARILPFLRALPDRTGAPMLLVTHDPLEVLALAEHVAVLENGRIVEEGDPRSVFSSAAAFGALHALGAENVFPVRVLARGEGIARLATPNGCALEMASLAGFPDPLRVAVRAEDILLATERPGGVSAQNVLAGEVLALEPLGAQVGVRIRAGGEVWLARVTTRAVESLALAAGRPVHMLVKAHAILPTA